MNINVDFSAEKGIIKRMNAVNNGPVAARSDQVVTNFETYKALKIPFARNHDAAYCSAYGGQFTVDVNAIFPDFDADENDPASYEFICTDKYIRETLEAGTETYYRLGQKIEQEIVKHFTKPPKDFAKWASICEHIIRHYNDGWADGFRYNITYWEIWNEPDGWETDPPELRQTWGGTRAEFHDLFEITAKHIKKLHPGIKIGGPAIGWNLEWGEAFIRTMSERGVPLDFCSWHCYGKDPYVVAQRGERYRELLDRYGYRNTESHCTEWAYVRGWTADWIYTLRQITGLKGSAYTAAVMQDCQNSSVDMLMYYDARPTTMNGLFDSISLEPLKTYHVFEAWRDLCDLGTQVSASSDDPSVFTTAARDRDGNIALLFTYFQENDAETAKKRVSVSFDRSVSDCSVLLLDGDNDLYEQFTFSGTAFSLDISPNASVLVKGKIK